MIRQEQIVATTRVDRHREQLALSALESLVEVANTSYVPVIVDHDPRCPPMGRVVRARIDELPDGHHAVVTTYEIFEPGEEVNSEAGREIPLRTYSHGRVQLGFDRSYHNRESIALIGEISELLRSNPQEEGKKALEPISVLMVGVAVIFGAVATGFLNALGADAYTAVKTKLKALAVPRRGERSEQLLRFEFAVSDDTSLINVDVIFTNPTEHDVDYALGQMLEDLDELLPGIVAQSQGIKRIVFEAANDRIRLSFGVRWDALPILPAEPSSSGGDSHDSVHRDDQPPK
jgi:hypothetical protein